MYSCAMGPAPTEQDGQPSEKPWWKRRPLSLIGCLGVLLLVLGPFVYLLVVAPAVDAVREWLDRPKRLEAAHDYLTGLEEALRVYADKHDGKYPWYEDTDSMHAVNMDQGLNLGPEAILCAALTDPDSGVSHVAPSTIVTPGTPGGAGLFVDPWRTPIRYRPPKVASGPPLLVSAGADGEFGTEDDISNYPEP